MDCKYLSAEEILTFFLEILKVIYSPVNFFKNVIKQKNYKGPILVLILIILAETGFAYVTGYKIYDELTLPIAQQKDEWTEDPYFWTSNGNVTVNEDSILGAFYGNKSIEFSINNKHLLMNLHNIGPINLSELESYNNLSFRIKIIYPRVNELKNATIYLFSTPTESFKYDLTKHSFFSDNSTWNNLTIPLGPENGWVKNSSNADWSQITSLTLEFFWSEDSNLTVRLDTLFFRGLYKSIIETAGDVYILNFALISFIRFTTRWITLGVLLYLLLNKLFRAKTSWNTLLILAGYALITMFVQSLITGVLYSMGPNVYRQFELFGGPDKESEIVYNIILEQTRFVSMIASFINFGIIVWTIGLCAIFTKVLTKFKWTHSSIMATLAYLGSILLTFLLGY